MIYQYVFNVQLLITMVKNDKKYQTNKLITLQYIVVTVIYER